MIIKNLVNVEAYQMVCVDHPTIHCPNHCHFRFLRHRWYRYRLNSVVVVLITAPLASMLSTSPSTVCRNILSNQLIYKLDRVFGMIHSAKQMIDPMDERKFGKKLIIFFYLQYRKNSVSDFLMDIFMWNSYGVI